MNSVVRRSDYSALLTDPRWQRRRLEALEWANWRCWFCSSGAKQLHVHHLRYRFNACPWEYAVWELAVACDECHKELHRRKEAGETGAWDSASARMQWVEMDLPDMDWHRMVFETAPANWRALLTANADARGRAVARTVQPLVGHYISEASHED